MRIIPDQLNSKNLVPFKKRTGRYKIPGMTSENEVLMNPVDPDLSSEEQSYVRHYLNYADFMISRTDQNAFAEPGSADSPESPLSAEKPLNLQPSADQPAASLIDESIPAKSHRPTRAA